ncbi:GPI mannosyltransferase 2, partial [Infundibulicybe gibba]
MRSSANLVSLFTKSSSVSELLLGGALMVVACDSTRTLYHLSLHHLGSPSLAFLASVLSLFPSSPATLYFAPYTEPFFTYFSYRGMLCCARGQWFSGALLFASAGTFRSNGIFLSCFILWGMIIHPFLHGGSNGKSSLNVMTFVYAILLTAIPLLPFISHNVSAYLAFCVQEDVPGNSSPPWCTKFPPLIYAHVQSTYWNVGFMRYFTPQQIPNFILAAPPLVLLFTFTIHHIIHGFIPRLRLALAQRAGSLSSPSKASPGIPEIFLAETITPHALHALGLSLILLFASHTQIVLRLAASMPIIYWAAAWLLTQHPTYGKWWVGWSVTWGAVSVVLWAAFLPP